MANGVTNFGGTFKISTTAANSDLTQSGFEALSYTLVPNIGNHDPTGVEQNLVDYNTWDNNVKNKGKGMADAGNPTIEFLYVDSAGMDLMEAAADVDNVNNYAFEITWADGSKEYNRGLVTGPKYPKGGNEDFKRVQFTLGLQQAPVRVDAS